MRVRQHRNPRVLNDMGRKLSGPTDGSEARPPHRGMLSFYCMETRVGAIIFIIKSDSSWLACACADGN